MRSMEKQVCGSEKAHSSCRGLSRRQEQSPEAHFSESKHRKKNHILHSKNHSHSRSKDRSAGHHSHTSNGSKRVAHDSPKPPNPSQHFKKETRSHLGQYFHNLMLELNHRKRALEERTQVSAKHEKELNKREVKRAKRKEAKYVAMLLKIGSSTNWNAYDQQYYILPTKWLGKWKKYVEYEEFVNKHKAIHFGASNPYSAQQEHPGRITHKEILADEKEYFHNYSTPEAICNWVLKEYVEEGKDYLLVSKELWEFLQKKYGGTGMVRYQINVGCNGARKLDLKLSKLRIVFIRKGQTMCEFPKPLYFPSDFTFLTFKSYVIGVFKFMHGKSEKDIRLWKLSPGGNVGFIEFMHYYRSQLERKVRSFFL